MPDTVINQGGKNNYWSWNIDYRKSLQSVSQGKRPTSLTFRPWDQGDSRRKGLEQFKET